MRSLLLPLAVFFSLAAGAFADSDVQVKEGTIHVRATAASLEEVIDKLKVQTGMKVDGPLPRTVVTLDFTRKTARETVLGILEGLGLSYALRLDKTGERVDTLMVFGGGPGASAPSMPTRPTFQAPPTPEVTPEEEAGDDEPAPDTPQVAPQPPGIIPVPQPGAPAAQAQPGVNQPPSTQPDAAPSPEIPGIPPGLFQRLPPTFRGQMFPGSSLAPATKPSPSP